MLKQVVQGAVKDNLRQLIAQFPTGFLLLNDQTGELYAASERAMSALKLDGLPTHWGQWPVPLKEFQLSLEGPDVQRAEVTIPWPENPRTFGFNLSTVTLDNLGTVRICLFSDITRIIEDRLALEQFKTAFMDLSAPETRLTQLLLALPAIQNVLSNLSMLNQTCLRQTHQDVSQLMPYLTRMAQSIETVSGQISQLQGDPHPLNIRPVALEQVLKSAWQIVFSGQQPLDPLPDSQTFILADSVRLEQALGLIIQAQDQPPVERVPAIALSNTRVQLMWPVLNTVDGPVIQLAEQLLTAMGMALQPFQRGLQLTAGRWCQDADETA